MPTVRPWAGMVDQAEVMQGLDRLSDQMQHLDRERARWEHFQTIPHLDRSLLPHDTVKGSQVLEPLFEFSGACAYADPERKLGGAYVMNRQGTALMGDVRPRWLIELAYAGL